MMIRSLSRVLILGAALAAFPVVAFAEDKPASDPAAPASQYRAFVRDLVAPRTVNPAIDPAGNYVRYLNLVTATYPNALGVEIADVEATLRAQLGLEDRAGVQGR